MSNPKHHLAKDEPVIASAADRRFLFVTYFFLAVLVLVIASVVFYEIALRDTWVSDNSLIIAKKLSEADVSLQDKSTEKAIAQYRSVLSLIGDHAIDDPALKERIGRAKEQVAQYEKAVLTAKRAQEQAALAAAKAHGEAAMIDPNNINDPLTVQVFIGAKQDYKQYGWNTNLLHATIKSQIIFERNPSDSNLNVTDALLSRFESEWEENRRNAGLPPEKLKSEIR